jgi:hypothetical protein
MPAYKVFKETALPGSLVANAIYLIAPTGNPNALEIYVTNSAGTAARHLPTLDEIQTMIDAAASSPNFVVATIAERNALTPSNGSVALVIDATGDGTVASGAATYVWRQSSTSWIKISEAESLDMTLAWSSITGRPTSSPAQIDSAVAASHSHTNKTQLDKIGESSGAPTYNGDPIVTGSASPAW